MELKRVKKALVAKIFLTICALLFSFQNCTNANFRTIKTDTKNSGNGEGYSGKPDQFRHYDPAQPCMQLDRFAKPLPNDEIFFQAKTSGEVAPFLVRQTCQDITPQELNVDDLVFSPTSNTDLSYNGKAFSAQDPPGDFDVVASACPAGTSPKAGAVRNNIFVAGLDWRLVVSTQGWLQHPGISIALNGAINSLPAYEVYRSDPANLDEFRRATQQVVLQANTRYVFSFLAKPGTRDTAAFRLYRQSPAQDDTLTVNFDLVNGTSAVAANISFAAPQVSMTPVPGGGYFCSVSFTTTAFGDQGYSDTGVGPANGSSGAGQLNDSIIATAAQLEKVSDFCQ